MRCREKIVSNGKRCKWRSRVKKTVGGRLRTVKVLGDSYEKDWILEELKLICIVLLKIVLRNWFG